MADSPDKRDPGPDEQPQIVPAGKTRPGGIGRTVFYILLASLGLAAIAWAVLEIWAYSGAPVP
ncbi:hypothetical protein ACUSIJ_22770 [Pseudochelatococcus sp. B33]